MPESEDAQITSREFDARIEEIRRAVDLARESSGESTKVELRDYIEAMFAEGQRATEMAERERSKAADALTTERYNAASTAESEREKSAQALRNGLDRAIKEGDERLREHIFNQVAQIQAALIAANALEEERFERAKAEVEALRREMILIQAGQQEAVNKAENAQKEVNTRGNDFRAQLANQAANLMPRKEVEATVGEIRNRLDEMLPRETFETSKASLDSRITSNTSRLDRTGGEGDGQRVALRDARGRSEFATSTLISLGVALVAVIGLIVTVASLAAG